MKTFNELYQYMLQSVLDASQESSDFSQSALGEYDPNQLEIGRASCRERV